MNCRGLVLVLGCGVLTASCAGSANEQETAVPDSGQCPVVCTPGQQECVSGTELRMCYADERGCSHWTEPVACSAGRACRDQQCAVGCQATCLPGSVQCYGILVQTCEAPPTPEGCASWSEPTACPGDQTCSAGACRMGCSDECVRESVSCDAQGVRHCELGEDRCYHWSVPEPCPAGMSCSGGRCQETCSDECALQSRSCAEGGVRECGSFDDDPCLEWSAVTPCPEGQVCTVNRCEDQCADECAAGQTRCAADAPGIEACTFDGECWRYGRASPCQEGQTCSQGVCSELCREECAAGSTRCAEGGVETCGQYDEDECAEWSRAVACPDGLTCSGGDCTLECLHECNGGATTCSQGGIRECDNVDEDPCAEWGPVRPCPEGQLCSGGRCVEECRDDCARQARRCVQGGWQVCGNYDGDDCLEWSETTACPAGQYCSGGQCREACEDQCAAGAAQCSDGGVQHCTPVPEDDCLHWGRPVPCPAGQLCSLGECREQCQDACVARSVRCHGEAVATCADYDDNGCLEWGEPVPCPAGQTCNGGACVLQCQPECAPGAVRCQGDGVQTCVRTAEEGSCPRWGAELGGRFVAGVALPCAEGRTCSNGQCQAGCVDECAAEARRCDPVGSRVQHCGNFDEDLCLDWSEGAPCGAGETCSDGACRIECVDECAEGESRCEAGLAAVVACGNHDGDDCREWGVAVPCGAGQLCEAGACVGCVAQPEVADGLDNDCDGIVDEAPAGTLPGWCVFQHPPTLTATLGLSTSLAFGRVWAEGLTEAPGAHPAVQAQLGYGPDGSEPSPAWSWVEATWVANCLECGNNDEYMARLTPAAAGEFDAAFRFSVDGGESWRYCHQAEGQVVSLIVGQGVNWVNLQWPHQLEALVGQAAGPFFGQAFHPGLTEAEGAPAELQVELGYGPDGTDPRDAADRWRWSGASYSGQRNANDEYQGVITVPTVGLYDVAFRYSLDRGASWTYGDIDGSLNGYQPGQAGSLLVQPESPPVIIQWAGNWGANLQRDDPSCPTLRGPLPEPVIVEAWAAQALCRQVVAEVYSAGYTDQDRFELNRLQAQVIRRPVDGQGQPGAEQTLPLIFYRRIGNNHEYRWDLPAADFDAQAPTTWLFHFRFSGDQGATWYRIGQGDGPEGGAARTLRYTR